MESRWDSERDKFGAPEARHICRTPIHKMKKPRLGRQIGKMALLTELEILGAAFLQRWRAYGAADAMDERGGHNYFLPTA
jgi:hypothetical protein